MFGIDIPFTPGIIPKEKGRIAEAVGGVISENLMNKEVLEKYLLSEDMVGKVRSAVDEFIATQQRNNETVSQFLGHYLSKEEIDTISQNINQSITKQTYEKLADSSVGEKVAHIAIDHVAQKLTIDGAQELLSGIGGALGGLGGKAVNTIESIYRSIITEHLPKILQSIDISKIVRERINEMDVNETEKLIFQVMDKELKAIVWLGALLGLVMGSINILI